MKINSILWDYDGTLVDTRIKNLNVTKAIMSKISSNIDLENSVLSSLESYELANSKSANWRELYHNEFGLNKKQIDLAGQLWTKYQFLDKTEVQLFDGINYIVQKLSMYSQGIVSQNSSKIIKNNLIKFNLDEYFNVIVGYEEVDFTKQKPNPEGLLSCVPELTNSKNNTPVIFIGDHITDIECAHNANEMIGSKAVISILLNNNKINSTNSWKYKPDYIVDRPKDILEIIEKIKST